MSPTAEEDATLHALAHPRVGDCFHEMYSFWMVVVAVAPSGSVDVVEFSPPDTGTTLTEVLARQPRKSYSSAEAFRVEYTYSSRPGAWVRYDCNYADVVNGCSHES